MDTEQLADHALRRLLVVVPTLNEASNIEGCLSSLLEGLPEADFPDVVVADGGSSDGTQAIVRRMAGRFPTLTLVHNPKRLQAAGVNMVVRAFARPYHRVLVRCDAHSGYPTGYLEALRDRLHGSGAQSVVVPMDARGSTAFSRASAHVVDSRLGSGGSAHRGGRRSGFVDHGHHAAFDLDWFRRLGGYDESLSHNEDAEYDRRLTEAGGRIWLEASARIDYDMRPDPGGLLRQYWCYGKGRARTLLKHRARPRLRQVVPAVNLVAQGLSVAAALLVSPLFWALPLLYATVLLGTGLGAARDLRALSALWAAPLALATIHNAWGAGYLWGLMTQPGAPAPKPRMAQVLE